MFELKNIPTGGYTLEYDINENIDYNNTNNIYLLKLILYFNLPYLPENMLDEWVRNEVKYISARIYFKYPESVEITHISDEENCICTIDIEKDENEEKYTLYIYGDMKCKVVTKTRPFVFFALDMSTRNRRIHIKQRDQQAKIKQKYEERLKNASNKEEKEKIEEEMINEIMNS